MGVSTCTCRYPLVFPNLTPFFIYILYLFLLHIILYRIILEEEKIKIKKKGLKQKISFAYSGPLFFGFFWVFLGFFWGLGGLFKQTALPSLLATPSSSNNNYLLIYKKKSGLVFQFL